MAIGLQEGLSVTLHGKPFRVLNARAEQTVLLLNERTSSVKQFTREEINTYREQGLLKIVEGPDVIFRHDGLPPIPSALPEHHRVELARRLHYVRSVLEYTPNIATKREVMSIVTAVGKTLGDPRPPSSITAYRWCRNYVESGQDVMSLAPRTANCGRRHGQVKEEVFEVFLEVVDEYFLTTAKNSRSDAHALLIDRILDRNKGRGKEEWLRAISFNAFCRWIRYFIDPFIIKARREGLAVANRYFRRRDRGPTAVFPLERVEIDHTVLDVLIVDAFTRSVIGRPTCTVAIDRRTRMVCAIHIDLEPPSSVAVLMCMKQAIESKQWILEALPGVQNFAWPVQGRPSLFCIDNGPEFHSHHYKRLCKDLHIDIQYCPPGKPWYKGAVERFLRTLNTGLIHRLPGTTRSNPVDRGAYPSEGMAYLTLEQLREQVWKWVVVQYHNRRHRELGETPLQAWVRLTEEHPVPVLPHALQLELEASLTFEVSVSNGRVRAKNLVYHHPYLVHLQAKLGDIRKVMLRINPQDVTQAYVSDPIGRSLIKVNCLHEAVADGMTWVEFKALRKRNSSDVVPGLTPDAEELRQAKVAQIKERHELHLAAEGRRKRARRTPPKIAVKAQDKSSAQAMQALSPASARPGHLPPGLPQAATQHDDGAWSVGIL